MADSEIKREESQKRPKKFRDIWPRERVNEQSARDSEEVDPSLALRIAPRSEVELESPGGRFSKKHIAVFLVLALVIGAGGWTLSGVIRARKELEKVREDISSAEKVFGVQILQSDLKMPAFGAWWQIIRGGGVFSGLGSAIGSAGNIIRDIEALRNDWPELIFSRRGEELRSRLTGIRDAVTSLENTGDEFASLAEILVSDESYLSFRLSLSKWREFLNGTIAWMSDDAEHHIMILFQNPSEIRPSGGFLGSFGDAVIKNGELLSLTVRDINEIDRTRKENIVTPRPLMIIADEWQTADANWFFDFPRSAEKVLKFTESSSLYRDKNIRFDGVIALTGRAAEDILAATGPIEVGGRKITSENLVLNIQEEVQAERRAGDTTPKGIIGELAEVVLKRLEEMDEKEKTEFIEGVEGWKDEKDIMVYMRSGVFQGAIASYGASGAEYELPQEFRGDYLAIVAANIDGAKTDLYMKQDVSFESRIGPDGIIENHLSVTRTHGGAVANQWWYRVLNQVYLAARTPRGTRVKYVQGGSEKKIQEPVNYAKEGYIHDDDIVSLEATTEEPLHFPTITVSKDGDKNVFATWMRTERGAKSVFTIDYERTLPALPKDGEKYVFVLETQAGIPARRGGTSPYRVTLNAPIGFLWEENNSPIYEWASDDPPGRNIIELTFKEL